MRRTVLLLLLAAAPAAAQQRTLLPGDFVQVRAPAIHQGAFRGAVVRYVADTLEVREEGTDSVHTMQLAQIRQLARNEGMNRRRSLRRGIIGGGFVGMAIGAVAGPLLAARLGDEGDFTRITAMSGFGGLALGTSVGAITGAVFPREQWQRFRMPPARCGQAPCGEPPVATVAPE